VQVVRVKLMARLMESGKLVAPRVIPKEIKIIKEGPQAPDLGAGGVPGGVPGGVAGGSMGGVIGGMNTMAQPLAPKKVEAIIDEHGNIPQISAVSGPPLLIPAVLDAVRKWQYEPTYLNDAPVRVQLNVTVTFRLND
jgi:protein TonB